MKSKRINRILVATDGSASAQNAVELGIEVAEADGAEVTFVHVTPPVEFRAGHSMSMQAVPRRLQHVGDDVLDAATLAASDRGIPFQRELIAGDAGDVIVALADVIDADLIVVGKRPRRLRVGQSVSRWVARHTSRPVLVARPRPAERLAA
jgi:nucleotide-binding universal stress UspA family protein